MKSADRTLERWDYSFGPNSTWADTDTGGPEKIKATRNMAVLNSEAVTS